MIGVSVWWPFVSVSPSADTSIPSLKKCCFKHQCFPMFDTRKTRSFQDIPGISWYIYYKPSKYWLRPNFMLTFSWVNPKLTPKKMIKSPKVSWFMPRIFMASPISEYVHDVISRYLQDANPKSGSFTGPPRPRPRRLLTWSQGWRSRRWSQRCGENFAAEKPDVFSWDIWMCLKIVYP